MVNTYFLSPTFYKKLVVTEIDYLKTVYDFS